MTTEFAPRAGACPRWNADSFRIGRARAPGRPKAPSDQPVETLAVLAVVAAGSMMSPADTTRLRPPALAA
jgi:hypothetical protein